MRKQTGNRRLTVTVLCAALALCAAAPPARAAGPAPVFEFFASSAAEGGAHAPYPPPGSGFQGPCGAAVDAQGNFYVSDYYHHNIDVFTPSRTFLTQIGKVDPLDGPCGLALGLSGTLYVNDYHRNVVRYVPAAFPLAPGTAYGAGTVVDSGDPTGVAVDPISGRVYVNNRTYIAVYDSSGAPVEVEKAPSEMVPLHIGEGTLEDGYGLAVASPPAPNAGRLYVADAATDTIKAYDPAIDTVNPVQTIDGHEVPSGSFVSLRDSALAIDRTDGLLYVADLLQPEGYERPEAAIYGFSSGGAYAGRLSYNVIDARPPGLAVDNSSTGTFGRVYVSSGNTDGARVYAYARGSLSTQPGSCAPSGPCPAEAGGFGAATALSGPPAPPAAPEAQVASAAPHRSAAKRAGGDEAAIVQKGNLRVTVTGQLAPQKLPRKEAAPIAVSVAGQISTTDASQPPQLKALRIEINRHGRLDYTGLPTCSYNQIQPASSSRALAACKSALVGKGSFQANIVLSGQEPYPTEGKLLVFNGEKAGKPVLFGQIYAPRPFATSFVIVFAIKKISGGTYGTALTASLPKALGSWGYVTGIDMRLARRFGYEGESHSYLSAACPAPKGFGRIPFPLARTSFSFAGAGELSTTLTRECGARG